jgi:hypothetical protein
MLCIIRMITYCKHKVVSVSDGFVYLVCYTRILKRKSLLSKYSDFNQISLLLYLYYSAVWNNNQLINSILVYKGEACT